MWAANDCEAQGKSAKQQMAEPEKLVKAVLIIDEWVCCDWEIVRWQRSVVERVQAGKCTGGRMDGWIEDQG